MAGPFDLTGQNIENTYPRILQTPDGVTFYDGTGSLVTFTATAAAGGSNTNIQFNSASLLSGSSNFSFDYTTNNVILTGSILMSGSSSIAGVDYIDFDTTASNAGAVGRLKWNDNDGTLDLGLKGGNVTLQIGQEEVARVVNKTGINLLEENYQAVRVTGAQGNRIKVGLAKGDGDPNSLDTIGLVTETILDNQEGFVTTYGLVRGIDTRGNLQGETWNEGDQLYLSPTTFGGLTNIPPTAPSHSVRLGYVMQKAPNGSIFVKVDNGYEIDELHNVNINTASLSYGDLLVYDTNVWQNTKQLTGSYGLTGSLNISGSITGSLFGIAATASYYQETDPVFVAKSASLATTGSNNFKGNQNITGSVSITGSLLVNDGTYNIIDTTNKILKDNSNIPAVDWQNKTLTGTKTTVDWGNNTLKDNANENFSIDWEQRYLYANDGITLHLDWSNPLYMYLPSVTENPIVSVLGIDGNGYIYITASSAIGGGGGPVDTSGLVTTSSFNSFTSSINSFTASYNTGSFTGSFTGSLFGTSSWANNVVSASFASTSSYFKNDTSVIERDGSGVLNITSSRIDINGPIALTLRSTNGINLTGTTTVTGNLLPGQPITDNTSSWNLGSPNAAWKDLYVSNGSVYFISGSISASIGFINGAIDFSNTPINVPSSSIVQTASFAQTASFLSGLVTSASYAQTASIATTASYSTTASFAQNVYAPSFITYLGGNQTSSTTVLADVHSSAGWDNIEVGFYEFEIYVVYNSSGTTVGSKFSISGSTSYDYLGCDIGYSTLATDRAATMTRIFDGGSFSPSSLLTTGNAAILQGHINITSIGQLRLRFASEIASPSNITVTDVSGYLRRLY